MAGAVKILDYIQIFRELYRKKQKESALVCVQTCFRHGVQSDFLNH